MRSLLQWNRDCGSFFFSFFVFNLEINLTFLLNIVFEHYKVKAEWREKKKKEKQKGLLDHLINQQWDYQVVKSSLGQNPTSLVTVTKVPFISISSSFTKKEALYSLLRNWWYPAFRCWGPTPTSNLYFHRRLFWAEPQVSPQLGSKACTRTTSLPFSPY